MSQLTTLAPHLVTEVPGPRSRELAGRLAAVECRNQTCVEPTPPIFWQRAQGANVWDVDGNRYVDLTAGFGVANAGHAHPAISAAVSAQAAELMHAMGDVHPAAVKVELLEALVRRFPEGGPAKAMLASSGSDAVEIALETALLASGRAGIVAFDGAYHGLALGALDATARPLFRTPFRARLAQQTRFARYGDIDDLRRVAAAEGPPIGAVLIEPIQGRGGERIPPPGFLREVRRLCDEQGWLLIADEIYTGCGRTGRWFACEHEAVVPDLLCVAKGLASGMPISACVGRSAVMDAWPAAGGEALRTQTFVGHPPACAAALASLRAIEAEGLVERAALLGAAALAHLQQKLRGTAQVRDVRGRGLLLGIECASPEIAARVCSEALARGMILLLSGDAADVLSITPPLVIGETALMDALDLVAERLR